eukprot:GHVU01099785.1.p1 GENE.GHVU01099785.1~~GHVU01099785.1.p1  ORF type:complete len:118 (-),score=11.73 GHVU01099785.1:161-514(-)
MMSLILYVWVFVSVLFTAGYPKTYTIYYRATAKAVNSFSVTISVENGKQAAEDMRAAAMDQPQNVNLTKHSLFRVAKIYGKNGLELLIVPVEYLTFDSDVHITGSEDPILAIGENGP